MGQKQNDWMHAFEAEMFKRSPAWITRIDWQTAKQFYHAGKTPSQGADGYIKLIRSYANDPEGAILDEQEDFSS